jgi:hypothetical protein
MKWSKMLKTGSVDARIMAVDLNTFMFTIERGQDLEEVTHTAHFSLMELHLAIFLAV